MKNKKLIITILFILYLIMIFYIFYNSDKRLVGVFSAIGASIYIITIRNN